MDLLDVSIVGKPNVGKSTFFNKIFNKEISKIGDQPGTTKEVISQELSIENYKIIFHDTGGLKKNLNLKKQNRLLLQKNASLQLINLL